MPTLPSPDHVFSSALPPAAVAAFRAIADPGDADIGALLQTVDYPMDGVAPRADALTPAQRAAVELITDLDLQSSSSRVDDWMPRRRADRRSWLGLDPARPLDRAYPVAIGERTTMEPAWRALELLRAAEDEGVEDAVDTWLATLPWAERLELWGEVNIEARRLRGLRERDFFDPSDDALVDGLGAEGKTWAPAYADRWLATRGTEPHTVAPLWPLLAIVRAGLPIEPRWDALLPGGGYRGTALVLRALPPERRGPALRGLLKRMPHPGHALSTAVALIAEAPDAEAMAYAIRCSASSVGAPSQHLAALANAAKDHPEMLALVHAAQGKRPTTARLRTVGFRDLAKEGPDAGLSALDERQILAAGRSYFGKKVPLTSLLSTAAGEERSVRAVLTYRALGDETGKSLYDVWQYDGDSGIVFAAGTTKQVASITQGTIDELEDDGLADALTSALGETPSAGKAKATTAKHAAKKTGAARKPGTVEKAENATGAKTTAGSKRSRGKR